MTRTVIALMFGWAAAAAADAPRTFGARIQGTRVVPVASVLAAPSDHTQGAVVVEGTVRQACQRKGCWMEIAATTEPSAPGCRVTFKDYGFFVPTDSIGARVRAEGVVQVSTVPAAHVKHLEAEGATFAQKHPDGTASEVRFVATGVELGSSR